MSAVLLAPGGLVEQPSILVVGQVKIVAGAPDASHHDPEEQALHHGAHVLPDHDFPTSRSVPANGLC